MVSRKKISRSFFRLFFLSSLIITLVFMLLSYVMVKSIENYAFQEMAIGSINTARGYSYSVSKNIEARNTILGLMHEKIDIAGETLASYESLVGVNLQELAEDLKIDTLDVYNPEGVVIDSTLPGNIGWTVYEGHPVHDFYKSGLPSYISGIRLNTISKQEFQYGYYRIPSGGFVQIGVSAVRIHQFLDNFAMVASFGEIQSQNSYICLCFIDASNTIIASTEEENVGMVIDAPEILNIIEKDQEDSVLRMEGDKEIFRTFVPIFHNGERLGTLSVGEETSNTRTLIRQISLGGALLLFFMYAGIIFLLLSTQRKNKDLLNLAYFDEETELPNQLYLKELMTEKPFGEDQVNRALILVHSEDYRNVHQEYGHEHLKDLMKIVLRKIIEETSFQVQIFSYTQDRFLLFVEGYENKDQLVNLVQGITKVVELPVRTNRGIDVLKVRFGITEIPREDKDISLERLVKEASVAMSTINSSDKVNHAFFSEASGRKLQLEEMVEQELRSVIEDDYINAFYLVFQPMVSMESGTIVAFEALSRFVSKKYGEIPPVKFIEIAEKKNLILPLGKIILTKACRYAKKLKDKGYGHIRVSVNLSGLQILSEAFLEETFRTLAREQVDGHSLIFEISENSLLDHVDTLNKKLQILREKGVLISLDNFGVGSSSLHHLKGLKVDMLKIDKVFIEPLAKGDPSTLITKDIINMAHGMGLKVVAEGIEMEGQLDYLAKHQCDMIQGYFLSEPLEEEEANLLLIANPYTQWPKVMEKREIFKGRHTDGPYDFY